MYIYPNNDSPQQDNGHLVPVSTEKIFLMYWLPVIKAEGYAWLRGMGTGYDLTTDNLSEVLDELRQLQAAFPRYYLPDDKQYEYITHRITNLITELEAINSDDLASGKLELFLG